MYVFPHLQGIEYIACDFISLGIGSLTLLNMVLIGLNFLKANFVFGVVELRVLLIFSESEFTYGRE